MNQFSNLPPEIIEFIFKKVYFNDLINLRTVDRRFKQICDQFRIKQLNVTDVSYSGDKFWFYTNDPKYSNKENQIEFSKFLNYKSIFRLDKYLRRLSIWLDEDFNISILNEFKLLEQMDIFIDKLNDNYKLNLENLKIADICISTKSDFKLTLDTDQLFAFNSSFTEPLDQFVFNYAQKVLFYETIYFYDEIKEFINLEYLKLNGTIRFIDRDILSKFKNLKTIDLHIWESINQNEYGNLKEDIISILNDKENLKRSEFQIYFCGVKLINQNQINQFEWSYNYEEFLYNQFEFQLKNYDLLKDNCYYSNEINYCDLIKLIKIIPSSFTNNFSYIHQVYANDHIDNEDQFIKFLNNLKYLSRLELINCQLPKSFYDKLINLVYLNELKYLIIKDKEELGLNFDFILNLKQLVELKTNQTIDNHIDLIDKSLKVNKYILRFTFKFDTKNYVTVFCDNYIDDYRSRSFYLDDNSKEIENFTIKDLNSNDLILKLKDLKF